CCLLLRLPPRPTLFPYTNALPICRVQLLVPGAVGRTQRLGGHRADDIRRRREHLGIVERKAPDGGHDLGPVDQRDAFLRTELDRSEEHTSELQSREKLVCRLLLEK